jgi:formiminotetrahydrofolate cyclodeaminase
MVNGESIGGWLDQLASSAPAPGGGAAAALETAMAAALVEMYCNLTVGKPAYAEHEATITALRDRAGEIRADALLLAAEDAASFQAVIDAYRLPKEPWSEAERRRERIQSALAAAADVPRRTAAAATEILDLAETAVPLGNINVVSDAAAAAGAARAALQTALLNIDANRALIEDPALGAELAAVAAGIEHQLVRADGIVEAARVRAAG